MLDLDYALGGDARLLIAGGLGLYLKQAHLARVGAKTLFPAAMMPQARTTQDIDLFVRTEVITDKDRAAAYRAALDQVGFVVVTNAKWLKFERAIAGTSVVLDLMVGPLDGPDDRVERTGIRVKPRGGSEFHARATDDAVGIEFDPMAIPLRGHRSAGIEHACDVFVPRAFPSVLMKLGALRDRIADADKDEGRHHALDLYRIVAMLTEDEERKAAELARIHAEHKVVRESFRVIDELFVPRDGIGRIRLREHPLCPRDADADRLTSELRRLLSPIT